MGVLDAPMAKVARTMVSTFGRSATLKRYSTPSYDDSTGVTGSGTATDVPCSAVQISATDSQIDGTLIQAQDRVVIVARSEVGAKPVADRDEFVMDSLTWRIVAVEPISSGEQDAAFELLMRR